MSLQASLMGSCFLLPPWKWSDWRSIDLCEVWAQIYPSTVVLSEIPSFPSLWVDCVSLSSSRRDKYIRVSLGCHQDPGDQASASEANLACHQGPMSSRWQEQRLSRWCWTFDSLLLRNVYGCPGIFTPQIPLWLCWLCNNIKCLKSGGIFQVVNIGMLYGNGFLSRSGVTFQWFIWFRLVLIHDLY